MRGAGPQFDGERATNRLVQAWASGSSMRPINIGDAASLSRRGWMKLVRQFIAWDHATRDPSRRARYYRSPRVGTVTRSRSVCKHVRYRMTDRPAAIDHTVLYGTDPTCPGFQAMNCLATFILSLRDERARFLPAPIPCTQPERWRACLRLTR
jgi:hypothetical protein